MMGGELLEIDNVKMEITSYKMNKRPKKMNYHKMVKIFSRKQITQKKLVVYHKGQKITPLGIDLHKQLVNMTAGECRIKTRNENGKYWNECTETNSSVIFVTQITDRDEKGEFKNFAVMNTIFTEVKHGFYPINVEITPQLTRKRQNIKTEQTRLFIWEQYVSQRIHQRSMHTVITENALLYTPATKKVYKSLQELGIQNTDQIQMLQYTTLQEQMNQYKNEHPSDASYILNNTLVIVTHYAKLKYKCHYGKEVLVFVLKRVAGLKTNWIPVLEKSKLDEYIVKIKWKKRQTNNISVAGPTRCKKTSSTARTK